MAAVLESSINWVVNGEAVNSTNINRTLKEFNNALGSIATKNTITSTELSDDAVTQSKISNGAVTADKIGTGAVTADKIGTGAVTADKIGTGAVTADKIEDGAITADKLSASAVSATIADGSITVEKIKETVDANHDPLKFLNEQGQFVNLPAGVAYTAGTGLTLTGSEFDVSYGTTDGTAAVGNDSRIVNGQTAYSWGNHASAGYVTSASIQNGQTYTAGSGLSLNSSNQFNVNIVNNLTTNSSEFVLSASQGVVLKTGIDSVISGSSLKVTDADWILITYDWSTFDGVDLDTQAYFYGAAAGSSTKLAITDGANYLGYGGGGYTITSNYSIDGGATSTPYGVGQFGGDVTQPSTGVEHVLINLKGMRNDTTRKTFKIDFKAKWYNTMYDGNVVLTFKKIIGPGDPTKTGSLWYPNSNQYFSTERAIIKGVTTGSHIDIASLIIDVNKNLIMFAQT